MVSSSILIVIFLILISIYANSNTLTSFAASNTTAIKSISEKKINQNSSSNISSSNKFVILNFDDGWKNHYQIVKPILDKYHFKATFYIVCNYVAGENKKDNDNDDKRMNWSDILALKKDGMDIGSHTMNHKDLKGLSDSDIEFEIGQSKKCLLDHGINATTFAYPFSSGTNNKFVINTISKYYDLGRSGGSTLMFLHCDGWPEKYNQKDCKTFDADGKLKPVTKYSMLRWANQNDRGSNDDELYKVFIEFVESQTQYNNKSDRFANNNTSNNSSNNLTSVLAIPIIVYHDVAATSGGKLTIASDLFEKEMKYLHDNNFKVITMSDLGYDQNLGYLYIK